MSRIYKTNRKVKNLITGEIYNSIKEAAEKNHTSIQAIPMCANVSERYLIFKNKYVFCFLKEDGTEDITGRHLRALEKLKKIDKNQYAALIVENEECRR